MRDRLVDRPSSAGIRRSCRAVTGPLMDRALLFVAPAMFDDQGSGSVQPARVERRMNFVSVGLGAYYACIMISIDRSTCAKDRPCLMQGSRSALLLGSAHDSRHRPIRNRT
jgi:hypothetical protein